MSDQLPLINIVTAVSREYFLPRILHSIQQAKENAAVRVRWILVFDSPLYDEENILDILKDHDGIEVEKVLHYSGPFKYGILQKNNGMGRIQDGYFYLLDDDNILHPDFLRGAAIAIEANIGKRAFVFTQKRWDIHQTLVACPENMRPCHVDNSMFLVHISLIGDLRYDPEHCGLEDFHFFKTLFDRHPEEFVFLNQELAYYNYLTQFPAPCEKPS